jgi:hypothetical protein
MKYNKPNIPYAKGAKDESQDKTHLAEQDQTHDAV